MFNMFGYPRPSPLEQEMRDRDKIKQELKELDEFKQLISKIVENYIKCLDTKVSLQDLKIRQATEYMTDTITETVTDILSKGIESGAFGLVVEYDEETESLTIVASGGV